MTFVHEFAVVSHRVMFGFTIGASTPPGRLNRDVRIELTGANGERATFEAADNPGAQVSYEPVSKSVYVSEDRKTAADFMMGLLAISDWSGYRVWIGTEPFASGTRTRVEVLKG